MGGSSKALRLLNGTSFMERMVTAFRKGGVSNIIVVTGYQADKCAALAKELGVKSVKNPNFATGMFSSIQLGLKAALKEFPASKAVVVSPVDAALVLPRSVAALLEAWQAQSLGPHPERIIVTAMNGCTGHPVLIPAAHIPAILARPASGEPVPEQDPDAPCGLRGYYHYIAAQRGKYQLENYFNIIHPSEESITADQSLIEIPLPDAGVLSDLDSNADNGAAEEFLRLTENRSIPSIEEAWQLLRLSRLNAKKIRHSILVARGSLRIGLKMAEKKLPHNLLLQMGAGLLHDLFKLEREHAVLAAKLLQKFGWPKTAFIVGCHTQLPDEYFARIGVCDTNKKFESVPIPPEAMADKALGDELFYSSMAVYMADKYARRDHLSDITQRFADIRNWFRETPEAIEGLDEREKTTKELEKWMSDLLGCDLLELVSTPSGHPLEEALDKAIDGAY